MNSLGQPWVWSVSDFIFVATAYECGWPVLSLTISSSHWQCAVSVLIIAELARGRRWSINFCPGRDLNPGPHGWRSNTLTTGPPRNTNIERYFYAHSGAFWSWFHFYGSPICPVQLVNWCLVLLVSRWRMNTVSLVYVSSQFKLY